jgi:hypothetical protein
VSEPTATRSPAPAAKRDELDDLLQRAERGDAAALARVKPWLNDPEIAELLGNPAVGVERQIIGLSAGNNLLRKEAMIERLRQLRAELAGPRPSPLERLLADRVALCWLHLHQIEWAYFAKSSMAATLAEHYQRCLDRAQRRFLAAARGLADVRRLALPVLVAQVNVAGKQVNVAAPADPRPADAAPTSRRLAPCV